MPITKEQKAQHISELENLISSNNIIVVWDYLGLSASEISEVRSILTNNEAVNKVYKNRLAKIAFKNQGKEEVLETLEGPSSFLFINSDESNALKELNKFIKENDDLSFKAGYIDGEYYDAEAIAEIAGLPSKEDLLSMLLSVLQANMRNLAYALSQVAENAPAGEESAPAEQEDSNVEEKATEEVKDESAPAEESTEENNIEEAPVEEATEEVVEETEEAKE